MKRMAKAKQKYDNIPIPKELSERVMSEIKKAETKNNVNIVRIRRYSFMKKAATTAAAIAILFTIGVNSSEVFAREVIDIPIIGSIARILTFRSYETQTKDAKISVDIPSIELISEDLNGLEKEVNEEIYEFCEQYADEALIRADEYKRAFLDTGGSEEEWAKHKIDIKVWYEVKALTDEYLSLAIIGSDNLFSAYSEAKYYSFDIKEGKWLSISDILDDDHMLSAEESIRYQVKQRESETQMEFWDEEWQGIDENTKFYINSSGNPVIVFEKYEIAPGAAGRQEFEVKK
ncbi:anti-sigma-V factor RsiV [Clostridiales bacterium]|nr:anti-sigma-V factor RsiV [Clostridiales bacterium]